MMYFALPTALLLATAAASAAAASEICPTIFADYHRRQTTHFDSPEGAFTIAGGAKHVPVLTLSDDGATGTIVVGNGNDDGGVWHPMVASDDPETVHFVTHVMVKDQNGNVVALQSMDPTVAAPATMSFTVPSGVTELTPYEWCNIHGLWVGEAVPIPTVLAEEKSLPMDGTCTVSHYPSGAWPSVHADFMRQQKETYGSDVPFTEADGEKHTPYITLADDGKSASIFVGKEDDGPVHPMVGSSDGIEEPHWITELYVVDQDGNIIVTKSLDPTDVSEARMEFDVPNDVEKLTAYSWCNIHGLWVGPTVEIEMDGTEMKKGDGMTQETKSSTAGGGMVSSLASAALGVTAVAVGLYM